MGKKSTLFQFRGTDMPGQLFVHLAHMNVLAARDTETRVAVQSDEVR